MTNTRIHLLPQHTNMHAHRHMHAHAHTCMHTNMHTHACTYMHAHTCMHTHMHAHKHAHAYMHAHTCMHTHVHCWQVLIQTFFCARVSAVRELSNQTSSPANSIYVSQRTRNGYVRKKINKEMFYLTMHSTHFIYGYMALDHLARKETRCHHYMGYSFRLAVSVLLYAASH